MCQMGTVPKQQQMVDSSCLVSYHTQTDALICWICSTSWFSSLKLSEYSPMLKTFYYWILLIKSLIEFINFPERILIRQYRICKYAKTFFQLSQFKSFFNNSSSTPFSTFQHFICIWWLWSHFGFFSFSHSYDNRKGKITKNQLITWV